MKVSTKWMLVAAIWVGFTPGEAHAYCIGGDTCPSADSDLDVYSICNSVVTGSGYAPCSGTLSMTPAHTMYYGRIYAAAYYVPGTGWQSGIIPVACIGNQAYPMRHSSYWGSGMVNTWSQTRDVALCFGDGNDHVQAATGAAMTCGGHTFLAWNYGGHWLELWGQGGDDTLWSGNGNDRLCGGTGDDDLNSSAGADDADGWYGDDRVNTYESAGDVAWGYYGNDIVYDAGAGSTDAVFGEFDADDCVMVDEATAGDVNIEVNGGTANCNLGSCSCGSGPDDSCADRSRLPLPPANGNTVGVEHYDYLYCPFF